MSNNLDKDSEKVIKELSALHKVVDSIDAYIFTKDKDGRYTYANQKVCDLFNLPLDEIIGWDDSKFFDLSVINELRVNDLKVIQEGQLLESEEHNVLAATGESHYYQVVKKPLRAKDNSIIGLFGLSVDITEQKKQDIKNNARNEQLLQNQQVLLQLTKENFTDQQSAFNKIVSVAAAKMHVSRAIIWLFNEDHTALVSQSLYANGAVSNEEVKVLAKEFPEYFSLVNESGFLSTSDVANHPATQAMAADYFSPLNIISVLNTPIRLQGKVIGIVTQAQTDTARQWTLADEEFCRSIADICAQVLLECERKQAVEQLRVSENQLKNVIEGAQLGYWDWDYKTGKHAVNERWLTMLGLSRADIKNHISDWEALIHPDDKQAVLEVVERHIQTGENYLAEFRMQHKQGYWVWIEGSGAVVEYEGSTRNPLRLCGTHQDISERKKSELELENYKDNLESLVIERTKELELSRDEAESASKAKSEFLSSMSHELRTPMNAVLGFSQLLASDTEAPLSEDQQESLGLIIDSGEHLLDLINDVLDLAKIESGKEDIDFQVVDVAEIITQVENLIQDQAEQQAICLVKADKSQRLKIVVDARKLKQILLNFASNAIKYNEEQGELKFSYYPVNDNKLRVCVSDTGAGIADELLPSVFESFNRLDKVNSNIQGTGIGLTICKQLVELMSGDIGVSKNPEKGLTFWIEFPLA